MRSQRVIAPVVLAVACMHGAAVAAPPSNDAFAAAVAVTSFPFSHSVDIREATTEANEPSSGCGAGTGGSVWYRIVPAGPAMIFDTTGTSFSHAIGLYKGTSLATLQQQACVFTSSGYRTQTSVVAGQTYYLRVAGQGTSRGTVALWLHTGATPPNAGYQTPVTVTAMPFSHVVDTTFAATRLLDPEPCGVELDTAVWYRVTVASERFLSVDTFGTAFDTVVGVFSQQPFPDGWDFFEEGCNDDHGGEDSRVVWRAIGGRTYYVMAGGRTGDAGVLRLRLEAPARPANDTMAAALTVGSVPFSHTVDNRAAVFEPGEPRPACALVSVGTVWYRYTETQAARRVVAAASAASPRPFATFAAVYALLDGRLLPVACANQRTGAVQFPGIPGVTYLIQAGGDSSSAVWLLSSDSAIRAATGLLTVSLGTVGA